AVELERDEPGEDERPLLDDGRARHDGVRALAGGRLRRHVEGALELRIEGQPVARRGDRRLDEDLERRLRGPRAAARRDDRRNGDRERERKRKASHGSSPLVGGSRLTLRVQAIKADRLERGSHPDADGWSAAGRRAESLGWSSCTTRRSPPLPLSPSASSSTGSS